MGGASSFVAMLAITGFLGASWTASKVSQALGISDIVLVIATGVLLGPEMGGLITSEYSQCSHARHAKECELVDLSSLTDHLKAIQEKGLCHPEDYAVQAQSQSDPHRRLAGGSYHSYEECLEKSCHAEINHGCQLTPDVFTLIGHAGVALMIFESGMHFDFQKAKVVGLKSCIVAVLGTVLPLLAGTLLTVAFGFPAFPTGVAAGTALAPTSVGIALRLLGEAGVLKENFGQAIITAAFVDDILSLILFNVLFSLGGEFDIVAVVVNPVLGVALMVFATVLAVRCWPRFINGWLLPKVPAKEGAKVARTDEVLFFLMFALLLIYAVITHFLGTHLWGCFVAGMSFATLDPPHHAHHVWVRQTKRVTSWMIRIFFACTVAFSIPISQLLSVEALWKGSIMGVVACIMTKVLCAPFMGEARWVIGWAMVGRAEFAYLIAQMAAASNMLDEEMFSIVIWALLWATVVAPFVFRLVLNRYVKRHGLDELPPNKSFFESESPRKLRDPRNVPDAEAAKEASLTQVDLQAEEATFDQLEAGGAKPEHPLEDAVPHKSDVALSDRQTSAGTSDGIPSKTAL
ncbi:High-affinity Na(+)/H(+) antiporter NhaS3 [Symbiodinium microadriaticum]|uniref:High-affinity Na(+)/H(+) antiporter NhaS3 n=1 Tax=Symbiodinium microadriaticum TaxID=2951 RepID=A0A1Q9CTP6_SYMMI|nr:High-affinity Na(+)/H(+) antiporter NhaS3 [Symbiodinium microadriaticum]CAE7786781.1 nhaS3 [Symbiodinium microadriaticum]CAE7917880.1 nhaS3 [Symbiodinium sp. KB8]